MTANSSDAGLILEYEITKNLINNYDFLTDPVTMQLQERDQKKILNFKTRSEQNRKTYNKIILSSLKINDWLKDKYNFQKKENKSIKRFRDSAGKKDFDVTDIEISLDAQVHCFSIKHNNDSSKHPRPEGLMQSLGFKKNSIEDKNYRSELDRIKQKFVKFVSNKFYGTNSFHDITSTSKYKELYLPICELYSQFLTIYGVEKSSIFFKWFSGSRNYLKVISWTKKNKISIQDYTVYDILPNKMTSWIKLSDKGNPYIYIKFSNNWIFEARLKNDSSVISKMQTKFDVKHYHGDPKKIIIDF